MQTQEQARQLIERCRSQCLWFLREDFVPETRAEWDFTLDLIGRYGSLRDWQDAERIRQWLSRIFSTTS